MAHRRAAPRQPPARPGGWRSILPLCGLAVALGSTGCGTLNGARPLEKGEHQVALTLGGPMVALGGAFIPLPNLVAEGRSGLPPLAGRPLDLNYGLNLTGLAFGLVGLHVGASWLLWDQKGGIPALSVTERLYFYNNWLDLSDPAEQRGAALIDQLELTASWRVAHQLLYVGLGDYLDFAAPELMLTPVAGAQLGRSGGRLAFQLEGRWMAVSQVQPVDPVTWLGGPRGAVAVTAGISLRLGGAREEEAAR